MDALLDARVLSSQDGDAAEVKRCRETACPAWAFQLGSLGGGRQDEGGQRALVAPPLKGLQELWGQRPGSHLSPGREQVP